MCAPSSGVWTTWHTQLKGESGNVCHTADTGACTEPVTHRQPGCRHATVLLLGQGLKAQLHHPAERLTPEVLSSCNGHPRCPASSC